MDETVSLISLREKPEYAPIMAHWSYETWYLKRDIPFDINVKAYEARATGSGLPATYVALVSSMPVGMVSLKEDDLWSRKDLGPWLASLYVLPSFRCRGIGEALINRAVSEAKNLGFGDLYLFLGHNEERDLKKFYTRQGWSFFEKATDNDGLETEIFSISLK